MVSTYIRQPFFDDCCRGRIEMGTLVSRQRAIDLAMRVHEDCAEFVMAQFPHGVAAWDGDLRPPL